MTELLYSLSAFAALVSDEVGIPTLTSLEFWTASQTKHATLWYIDDQ